MYKKDRNLSEKKTDEFKEDSTKYEEYVPSYFSWIPLSKQKRIANKLENITKDKND